MSDWAGCRRDTKRSGGIFDLANKGKQLALYDTQMAQDNFWADNLKAKDIIAKANELKAWMEPCTKIEKGLQDLHDLIEYSQEEAVDSPVRVELSAELDALEKDIKALEFKKMLGGPLDKNNAILNINAGAGGTESCDWAEMLLRMYSRHAESKKAVCEILDILAGEEAGIKNVTMLIKGEYAYGYLKAERGVHRLVRISPFDSNARRHTSFASVDVIAEVDESIDIQIDEKDLRIDTYRSSGAGGQKVNKTDSAVRLTHMPSGIVVACQNERSQHKNKATAMNLLRAKLYERELQQKKDKLAQEYGLKKDIAWGSQMRSYVLHPYQMVKDHRTDVETSNTTAVLDGDIDAFIEAYLKMQ